MATLCLKKFCFYFWPLREKELESSNPEGSLWTPEEPFGIKFSVSTSKRIRKFEPAKRSFFVFHKKILIKLFLILNELETS